MKLATLLTIGAAIATANAASNITIKNFGASGGLPLVDNTGAIVDNAVLSWDVGTFEQAFADTLGSLNVETDDDAVLTNFTSARTGAQAAGTFNFDGLFSGTLSTDDGGALTGSPLFAIATYDLGGGATDVMVFSFGADFPVQDGAGNAAIGLEVADGTEVVFGGGVVPVTNDSGLPGALQGRYANGLAFNGNGIPEPSTGLLSLIAGLGLLARRRR